MSFLIRPIDRASLSLSPSVCVLLSSLRPGGTDIVSCFMGQNPTVPVHRGEIQTRNLGMAVEAWSPDGECERASGSLWNVRRAQSEASRSEELFGGYERVAALKERTSLCSAGRRLPAAVEEMQPINEPEVTLTFHWATRWLLVVRLWDMRRRVFMGDFEKLFSFKAKSESKEVSIRSSAPILSFFLKKRKKKNSDKIGRAFVEIRKSIVKIIKRKDKKRQTPWPPALNSRH